ncbi:TonB-dependent receptor [Marinilongibacter aquaticus]|uniref:TonB-dependent receptor n=1 Tax=Marinilongibacter aquaticus TaxID=2975157 RepID=UPI0021BD592F|nr:TonB-dependent receptor [Marinilongibacter aquaticus]UBM59922.1 TonB-dependent receptor [Marinilongibacter aquaticus]
MKKNSRRLDYLRLIMKTSLSFFLVSYIFCNLSFAISGYSQIDLKRKVTLHRKNEELKEVLKAIELQTNLRFVYSPSSVDIGQKVSVEVKNKRVDNLLDEILPPINLKYIITENRILIRESQTPKKKRKEETLLRNAEPENVLREITGQVKDENNMGIPGATVVVKGTQTATQSDMDGNFRMEVAEGVVILLVSYVGYSSKEVELGKDEQTVIVQLAPDATSLSEVVVVGYGSNQKVNLTGAISTIKFDEEVENRPITNASQALGGTASGVWVSQNSGKPGSDGAQIRVRGWGTLNNSNPLIIVDGVEGSFDQLNPSDIQSISVLKDAASAAIYGSKAANGVVLVTTKVGERNEKMRVNFNSYVGVQSLGRHYNTISNSVESMELTNAALVNAGSSAIFPQDLINQYKSSDDAFKYPNTDWFKVLFQDALIQQNNISITGGSAQTSTFLSFNYLKQNGMVSNTNSQRYGLRANVNTKVNKWFDIGGRLGYINRNSKEPYSDVTYGSLGRVFEMLSGATPYIAPYTRNGDFGSVEVFDESGAMLYDNRNPLIDAANGRTISQDNLMTANVTSNIYLSKDLVFKTTYALNGTWSLVDRYNSSVYGYTDSGIETTTKNYNREGLEMNRGANFTVNTNLFSTLNYTKNINGRHDFKVLAGFQNENNKIQTVYARRTKPPKEGLTQVDAGTSGIQGTGNMNRLRIVSYFGRLNYALDEKYLFEANIRADGSSRFKSGERWGYFPGFSVGWRISEEPFLAQSDFISNMKFRASWGKLGNQNISSYSPYLTIIDQNNGLSYNYGGTFAAGAAITSLIDNNISWEQTSTLDIGLELAVLNNRFSIEADYFRKNTTDILVQLPIPLVLGGLAAPVENKGAMQNDGFELIFNYYGQKYRAEQLNFNLGVNMTYINNKVTDFGTERSPDQLFLIREGYSYKELYGYKVEGIYQSDEEAQEHMYANGFVPKAGNLRFQDLNNDGRLDYQDKQSLGNTIPKLTFGVSPSFKYRGFDLNLLLQGVAGVNLFNRNNFTNLSFENRVIATSWLDAWTPENKDSNIPMARFDNSWDNQDSDFWIVNGSFLKIKNAQLGYTLPENWITKYGLRKAYLYVNAQNVLTMANKSYNGYDPEKTTFDSSVNVYPVPRILSLGVNLNF